MEKEEIIRRLEEDKFFENYKKHIKYRKEVLYSALDLCKFPIVLIDAFGRYRSKVNKKDFHNIMEEDTIVVIMFNRLKTFKDHII